MLRHYVGNATERTHGCIYRGQRVEEGTGAATGGRLGEKLKAVRGQCSLDPFNIEIVDPKDRQVSEFIP